MSTLADARWLPGRRERRAARLAAVAALLALALLPALWQPPPAAAHPLGNFTTNRYSRIEISPDRLRIRYVLDQAEIPTFQAMPSLDANGDRAVTDAEKNAYAAKTMAEITRNLSLSVDGRAIPLRVTSQELELLPGQAGLQVMRLAAWLEAPGAAALLGRAGQAGSRVEYRDGNEPGRIGWREMLVQTSDGVAVGGGPGGAMPSKDVSDELRAYPEDLLMSPIDVRELRFSAAFGPAGGSTAGGAGQPATRAATASLSRASDGFAELFTSATSGSLTPPVIMLALLTATLLGGLHALSPGHGKTIVGAYLVGSRGTARHALFLGLTVTAVHTAGVFALGLATLVASQYFVPERIYPWMSLASGLLVLGMGVSLVRARLGAYRGRTSQGHDHSRDHAPAGLAGHTHAHADAHSHDGHDHGHDAMHEDHSRAHAHAGHTHDDHESHAASPEALSHSHGFGSHTHAIPGADGAPVTWRSLLALGIAGGLLPCPSALVVMLGAIALHQVGFGLVLIVFFSAGLAATLIAIGLLMVYSGRTAGKLRLVERLGSGRAASLARLARLVPVLSAGVVALAGLALSVEALRQMDVSQFWSPPSLRTVAANALSLGLGALVVFVALRRRSSRPALAAVPVVLPATMTPAAHSAPDHAAHSHDPRIPVPPMHGHAHEHAHDHLHGHAHDHDHSHDHSEVHEHVAATVGGRVMR